MTKRLSAMLGCYHHSRKDRSYCYEMPSREPTMQCDIPLVTKSIPSLISCAVFRIDHNVYRADAVSRDIGNARQLSISPEHSRPSHN